MQRAGVAEQREIGREIERVEIDAAVGQALLGYAHPIEAQHLRACRQIALKLFDEPLGVERRDEHRARPAGGELVDRKRAVAEHLVAELRDVLNIDSGQLDTGESEDLGEPFGGAERIDDCGRGMRGECADERASRPGGMRVRQRLIERVAAANVVEGLDAQSHARRILHRPEAGRRVASMCPAAEPARERGTAADGTAGGLAHSPPPRLGSQRSR